MSWFSGIRATTLVPMFASMRFVRVGRCPRGLSQIAGMLALWVACLVGVSRAGAQGTGDGDWLRFVEVRPGLAGTLNLVAAASPGAEVVLLWGETVERIDVPIATERAGADGTLSFEVERTGAGAGYFRGLVVGGTRWVEVSPAPGEEGVALTRETIFRFDGALAEGTTVGATELTASFGGRRLLSRVEVSRDRRTVSLFYLEPLPANARVQVRWDAAGLRDERGREPDWGGLRGADGVVAFEFGTLGTQTLPGTVVVGRVLASELVPDGNGGMTNRPLSGVTISVDGAEETIRATTDAEGWFRLDPSPSGRFFVTVDGRTAEGSAWPTGAYYPFVGKAWEAQPGRTNLANGNGEIYLPRIAAGSLVTVSAMEETAITFPADVLAANPALEGVSIRVPANGLFANDGTRGGRVGIAPVASDRLPEPLPAGLAFPLVITIQTDGPLNFDAPVPVRFPNLPDPVTGEVLPPGAPTALWSFNHDTGRWEIQGSMTVTADGRHVDTDPGVGVRQPGWHGARPGTQSRGGRSWFGGGSEGSGESEEVTDPCRRSLRDVAFSAIGENWQAIGECATSWLPWKAVRSGADCAMSLAGTMSDLLGRARRTREEIREHPGATGRNLFRIFLVGAKVVVDGHAALLDCVKKAAVGTVVDRFLNCGTALAGTADSVCRGYLPPAGCAPSPALTRTCVVTGAAVQGMRAASAVATGEDFHGAEDLQEKVTAGVGLVKDLVDVGLELVGGEAQATGRALAGLPGVPDDAVILALMDDLVGALEVAAGLSGSTAALYDATAGALEARDGVALRLGELVAVAGQRVSSPVYYAIEVGDVVLRGTAVQDIVAILGPELDYRLTVVEPRRGLYGETYGVSARNGAVTTFPAVALLPYGDRADSDGDGLPDVAEWVIGTDPGLADTDGDGISDGAEVRAGTDPLDGLPVRTGVIASAPATGVAVHVAVRDDWAVTANGTAGITVFEVSDPFAPRRWAELDTPGNALEVALGRGIAAVADGPAGLTVVDVNGPLGTRLRHRVPLGGTAVTVALEAVRAWVGLSSGDLVGVDLETGQAGLRLRFPGAVDGVALEGDVLHVLTRTALLLYRMVDGTPVRAGEVAVAGQTSPLETGRKLFVGDGLAYVGHFTGFTVVDVRDPMAPRVVGTPPVTQAAVHGLAANGSGVLLAVTSFGGTQTLAVSMYDVREATDTTRSLATFETPGTARAVAIYRGLGYVADGARGLQVLNYLPYDRLGVPPTIGLGGDFVITNGVPAWIEGRPARLTARVTDDVQVREVTFHADGVQIGRDGSFPFEHRLVVPAWHPERVVVVRARAIDTGGNATWSEPVSVRILPDPTPPAVRSVQPGDGARVGAVSAVRVTFTKPVDPDTLAGALELVGAGPDEAFDTPDDRVPAGLTLSYRALEQAAVWTVPDMLAAGRYRVRVLPSVRDLTGNALAEAVVSTFATGAFPDADGDCLPDDLERVLELDPFNPDTDGNGVLDGDEDFAGDGISNCEAVFLGKPLVPVLASGRSVVATLRVGGVGRYQIDAAAGERLLANVGWMSGSGTPHLRVYGPDGVLVNPDGAATVSFLEFEAAVAGTYYVLVRDVGDNQALGYRLTLVRVPGDQEPDDEVAGLVSGRSVEGVLPLGDLDVFTYGAGVGERLIVNVGWMSGSGTPHLRVYGPDGVLVNPDEAATVSFLEFEVAVAGTYSFVVRDVGDNQAMGYRLTLVRVPGDQEPNDEVAGLVSGRSVEGVLPLGDLDVFTYAAGVGERLIVNLGWMSGSGTPHLRVYGPDGVLVNPDGAATVSFLEFEAAVAGTYTFVVREVGDNHAMGYRLTLVRVPGEQEPNDEAAGLVSGRSVEGVLPLGDLDVFTYAAGVGERLIVNLGWMSGSGTPHLRVYGPDGVLVNPDGAATVSFLEFEAAVAGTYFFVVREVGDNHAMGYRLTLLRVPGEQEPNDEAAGLVSGRSVEGVLPLGDLDVFTYAAGVGERLIVNLGWMSGSGTPHLRVYGPDGVLVNPDGAATVSFLEFEVAVAGTYTFVVREVGDNHSMGYRLTLLRVPGAQEPNDEAVELAAGVPVTGLLPLGDLDVFQFGAVVGEPIRIGVVWVSGSGTPHVRMYGPRGNLLNPQPGVFAASLDLVAGESGTHTVVVRERGDDHAMGYRLTREP
ncbi:MAG: Ig-like domain-containing protein [Verrucomicrobiae bacterium]|nr:Ig-like domain-containing protein [Verrucomicrobiae bacterium]